MLPAQASAEQAFLVQSPPSTWDSASSDNSRMELTPVSLE
jgi:hypothetical protein